MELTKEQIQLVEKYLHHKNFNFIDLKVEVLDHMISDIEVQMESEKVTFQYAFATAKQKWNPQFKETSTLFFGLGFSAPKIVIQKAKKVFWKQYVFLLASYFLPFIALTEYDFKVVNPSNYSFFIFLKLVLVFSLLAFLYMLIYKNSKVNSTYSFILKSQSLGVLTGLIVLAVFFSRLKELDGIHVGMLSSFIYTTIIYFHFYKKHQQVIKKYKIS